MWLWHCGHGSVPTVGLGGLRELLQPNQFHHSVTLQVLGMVWSFWQALPPGLPKGSCTQPWSLSAAAAPGQLCPAAEPIFRDIND